MIQRPTDREIQKYLDGYCMFLAIAIHDLTNLDVWATFWQDGVESAIFNNNNHLWHSWVVNNNGKAIDIRGIHKDNVPSFSPLNYSVVRKVTDREIFKFKTYKLDPNILGCLYDARKIALKYKYHLGIKNLIIGKAA